MPGDSRVPMLGLFSLIDINDVYSRVNLLSFPYWIANNGLSATHLPEIIN